jgi:hypothetical protein
MRKLKVLSVLGSAIILGGGMLTIATLTTGCNDTTIPNNKLQFAPDNRTLLGFVSGYTPPNNSKLIIPAKTQSIGNFAFDYETHDTTKITSIDFTQAVSLGHIGKYAFRGCSGLTGTLVIPNAVLTIGVGAFAECSKLSGELIIPNSVTSIGEGAFSKCSGLTGVLEIPNNVISLGKFAFSFCNGFTGLIIPASVHVLDQYVFAYCSGFSGTLTIPNTVTTISVSAFAYCSGFNTISCNYDSTPTVYFSTFSNMAASGTVINAGSVGSSELCQYFIDNGGLSSG